MIQMERFKAEHIAELLKQEAFDYLRPHLTDAALRSWENSSHAMTGFVDGAIVFCAGVRLYWPGRGESWAFLAPDCKSSMVAITRAVRRFLDVCPIRRIEASVECGFEQGHRWVKALGFQLEAERLRAFLPNGRDCALYARVQ